MATSSAIAVVGMACVFPGAHSPEELWQNVLAGRRLFRKAPPERLPRDEYCDPDPEAPGKSYCDQLALITGWAFDPFEFRIPPVVERASDIAHWLALWTTKQAIRDARLDLDSFDRSRVGAILGNTLTGEFSRSHALRFRWPYVERSIRRALGEGTTPAFAESLLAAVRRIYEAPLPEITEDSLAGNMSNTIVGRICSHFDFGAGGYAVDGACSSSLLAVAHACEALLRGDMDLALAGGVDVSLDPFEIVGFAKARALAAEDIRPYDETADGMLAGEGCGIFVLAREEDARAQGWRIRALIRGWGISSDGHGGITSPEIEGQARALRNTYKRAGYPISSVGLFEGHGTGTALGDRVEVAALRKLIDESSDPGTCWIGSIKGNIGHCKAAAGSAGLVKAIMALERKIIPPTMNCRTPHPVFGRPLGRLKPAMEGLAWAKGSVPRRASVSSMGFGGANSHVTLEEISPEAVAPPEDLALLGSHQDTELILFSADDPEQLGREAARLGAVAGRISRAELTDLAAALADAPLHRSWRAAVVAESPWQLEAVLSDLGARLRGWSTSGQQELFDPAGRYSVGPARAGARLAALFPGQASQGINMGAFLHRRFPFVRRLYREADRAVADLVPEGLTTTVFLDLHASDEETRQRHLARLRNTRLAQPAIVLVSIAVLRVLEHFGLRPDLAIGHSLGEITALHAMGAFDEMTAIRVAALRGLAMATLDLPDAGAMVAVQAGAEQVREMIRPLGEGIAIANYNSPRQSVVSGSSESIRKLVVRCRAAGIGCTVLPVSHAFHSGIVAPAAETLRSRLGGVTFHPLRGKVISTALGRLVEPGADLASLLADQIRLPVRLTDAVARGAEEAPDLWVEAGPGDVLCRLVTETLGEGRVECLPADPRGEEGSRALNRILGRAYVLGLPLAVDVVHAHRFRRPFPLEDYRPLFITNPCERPVEPERSWSVAPAHSGAADLAPEGAAPEEFQAYLDKRLPFLREFVAMDYRSRPPEPLSRPESAVAPNLPDTGAGAAAETPAAADDDVILDFAIEWIARRTGFPVESVRPAMRLRDDLNLDSIKAGELTLVMARRFKGEFDGDPSRFMNAPLEELVRAFRISGPEITAVPAGEETDVISPQTNIPDSVRLFRTATRPFPLGEGDPDPLPAGGTALVVADQGCPQTDAVASALAARGLAASFLESRFLSAGEHLPADLRAIVVLLPAPRADFLSCTPEQFDRRVDGLFAQLFGLFRWVMATRATGLAGLRVVVARAEADPGGSESDLDAGGGFLRSLQLEQPEGRFKWVSLPAAWTADRWAETVVRELEDGGKRVVYRYTSEGMRTGEVAIPVESPGHEAPPLDGTDTVLATGGAKGITFELAFALAQRHKVKLALLGSSQPPVTPGPPGDEMTRNILRLTEAGIRFHYVQCDVTNRLAVREAVRLAELQLGPVTAVLHGAGVSNLRLLREADARTSARAVRVKTRGLYNILAEVPPARLKAVHVLSSVLGTTGMKGQTDYTFANAWLNGALRSLEASHPHLHCLALGYSVWSETGLGKKLGAVASLESLGITPIGTREGVGAYLSLLEQPRAGSTCLIAGRMTPELEEYLFGRPQAPRGRFLERILRWIPGGEVVANATLHHEEDLYLPEHVFQGTTLFPGVMALEAMVEVAQACVGSDELPVLHSVRFMRPLIVPPGERVVMRVIAVADPPADGRIKVKVAVRSDADGFRENHFRADCWFGLPASEEAIAPLAVPERLALDPESFSPWPLFQGKFFRRIAAIRLLDAPREAITEIAVPEGERCFRSGDGTPLKTVSAAARDSFLQSGALLLPPGYLPVEIGEVRFHAPLPAGESVFCRVSGEEDPGGTFTADIAVFSKEGRLVETMRDIRLETSATPAKGRPLAAAPLPLLLLETEVRALVPAPLAFAIVWHAEVAEALARGEITAEEQHDAAAAVSARRLPAALANLLAARRAGARFIGEDRDLAISPSAVSLIHHADGKPELRLESGAGVFPAETDVSLTDANGISLAAVGPRRIGIDLEPVVSRDAETWLGLLGVHGYAVARDLVWQTGESFDRAATRVWTLAEARKKTGFFARATLVSSGTATDSWIRFTTAEGGGRHLLSGVCRDDGEGAVFAFAIALSAAEPQRSPSLAAPHPPTAGERVDEIIRAFFGQLEEGSAAFGDDPVGPETEAHHRLFREVTEQALAKLQAAKPLLDAEELLEKRRRMYAGLRTFSHGSAAFRRTLEKPLGYPGDHLLMDMIFRRELATRGLGYHFDRAFLGYSGCEAIRQRSLWVVDRVRALVAERGAQRIALLDLGCGPMAIERTLVETAGQGVQFSITGMDFDPRALEYATAGLQDPRVRLRTSQQNLISPQGVAAARAAAAEADVCICMGLIEYLEDEAATAIYEAFAQGARPGTVLLTSNYRPGHHAVPMMEWFLDWWLVYRTESGLARLVESAGFPAAGIRTRMDATDSIVLLEARR